MTRRLPLLPLVLLLAMAAAACGSEDTKLKVTTQIMGDHIRVSGKKKDDLQAVMAALRNEDWPRALQFQNYR